jgi:murein DD-endopeptidase MepM/ murein hydrolase activator NlpD
VHESRILAHRVVASLARIARTVTGLPSRFALRCSRSGRPFALTPTQWAGVAVLALSGVAAFGLAPDTTLDTVPTITVTRALPAPALSALTAAADAGYWREERVRRGDTVGSVLARLGVDDPDALAFLHSDPAARALYSLRPGKALTVETDAGGALLALRFIVGDGQQLAIARKGERFAATSAPPQVEVRRKLAAGEIRSSLFAAADAAGMPDAVTLQLADVFGGDIDFYKDLQRGDRFAVVYEMRYVDGEAVGAGRIVAAVFDNRGKTFQAFRWRDGDGNDGYYAADGSALRKAFLRSPMEFSRVTSGFSNARFHPILQTWRAHKGVDYAAPIGTPVRATANGRVRFAGTQNGYGNVVVLQHAGVFSTLYAHLSRFASGMRAGARVEQGRVIGYVGQTGWATGPHLHYEFRVADVQRNPLTIALPGGEPLPAAMRPAFVAGIATARGELEQAHALSGNAFADIE